MEEGRHLQIPSFKEPDDAVRTNFFSHLTGNILFEFNKTRFRLKKSFVKPIPDQLEQVRQCGDDRKLSRPSSKISVGNWSLDRRTLSSALSSVSPVSPSERSFPECDISPIRPVLTDLPQECLVRIATNLAGRDAVSFTGTCSSIRKAIITWPQDNQTLNGNSVVPSLRIPKHVVTSREISVLYNMEECKVVVLLQRKRRSIQQTELEIVGRSLEEVFPSSRLIVFRGKCTFGNGVNFADFRDDLSRLFHEGRLIPTSLYFNGGDCNKGNRKGGVDVRCFSEGEFVSYAAQFTPHLKTLHLQTTKHFKMSTSSPRLLSFVSLIREFGCVYERPALRYHFSDLKKMIEHWQHEPLSHSCTLFIRRPSSLSENYTKLRPHDYLLDNCQMVKQLTFVHVRTEHIYLNLCFH